ncbi:MAG: GntR family transcriptional regulator [Bryobacteraceae bacterium]|nr:GntR family transcriptional regulator [Bryobacteraceae bacterium]
MSTFQGNLTEHAYLLIRDRILSGQLSFGASLSRRELADQLGISIVPVGDALQRLEGDGLVESRPRVGTRVRIPTPSSVRGQYILREALESQAARIFAEKASPAEREELKRLARQLDEKYAQLAERVEASRERMFEIHRFHMRFHMRLAECTGCEELCQAVEKNQVLVFNWLYDTAIGDQLPPPGWHAELAEGVSQSNPELADAAMRKHTRYRMDEVLQRMEPYFGWSETRLAVFPKRARKAKKKAVKKRAVAARKTARK